MVKWFSIGFWELFARIVLRNRIVILLGIAFLTLFLGMQWKNIRFSYTEANLLPDNHHVNNDYNSFLENFGEEGNMIVIGSKDPAFFTPKVFTAWNKMMASLKNEPEVSLVVSIND